MKRNKSLHSYFKIISGLIKSMVYRRKIKKKKTYKADITRRRKLASIEDDRELMMALILWKYMEKAVLGNESDDNNKPY